MKILKNPNGEDSPIKWFAAMFFSGLFVLILMLGPAEKRQGGQSAYSERDLQTWAYIMSQSFLERYLKAPASAKFPSQREVRIQKLDGFYLVNAHVDAQNSFGAALRQNYTAKMVHLGGDRWRCDYLELGTDVLIAAR